MKIVVVGVGALGSHFVLFARNLEADIAVVDFDRIEAKNVLAQFHTTMSVGKNKAMALKQTMSGLFGRKIDAVPYRLTSDNVDVILGKADLVIDALDNASSRRIVQNWVRKNGVACLHGAVDANGSYGRVVWDEMFRIDEEGSGTQATCEDGENLPWIAWVGARMAETAKLFVKTGKKRGAELNPGGMVLT